MEDSTTFAEHIIILLDNSSLNKEQTLDAIMEVISYYNLEHYVQLKLNE